MLADGEGGFVGAEAGRGEGVWGGSRGGVGGAGGGGLGGEASGPGEGDGSHAVTSSRNSLFLRTS